MITNVHLCYENIPKEILSRYTSIRTVYTTNYIGGNHWISTIKPTTKLTDYENAWYTYIFTKMSEDDIVYLTLSGIYIGKFSEDSMSSSLVSIIKKEL